MSWTQPILTVPIEYRQAKRAFIIVQLDCGHATNLPKAFVAGDIRCGQSLLVWAISEGRQTAGAVDELLMMGFSDLPR